MAYGETVPSPSRCLDETWSPQDRPLRIGVRLAIDVGSVRIGVARCDRDGRLASPLTTVPRGRGDLDTIEGLAAADDVIEIIAGLPVGLSGAEGRAASDARTFAAALALATCVGYISARGRLPRHSTD